MTTFQETPAPKIKFNFTPKRSPDTTTTVTVPRTKSPNVQTTSPNLETKRTPIRFSIKKPYKSQKAPAKFIFAPPRQVNRTPPTSKIRLIIPDIQSQLNRTVKTTKTLESFLAENYSENTQKYRKHYSKRENNQEDNLTNLSKEQLEFRRELEEATRINQNIDSVLSNWCVAIFLKTNTSHRNNCAK